MIFGGEYPIYVINLKRREDKKQYIESLFKNYKINNYFFIDAVDGKKDISHLVWEKPTNLNIRDIDIAATISHIKAIQKWISESRSEYALIFEDDISFETVKHWAFSWEDFVKCLPKNFDAVQLSIIFIDGHTLKLHKKREREYSAAAYIISRDHAKNLIEEYYTFGKYKFTNNESKVITDHNTIFSTDNSYSIPLFVTTNIFETDNPDLIGSDNKEIADLQNNNKNIILSLWKNNKLSLEELVYGP